MKSTRLLTLALCAVALSATGCATKPTHNGRTTYFLGGLVTMKSGDYQPTAPAVNQVDLTTIVGKGNPSGSSVGFFWDAVKVTDY